MVCHCYSLIGKRDENEDKHKFIENIDNKNSNMNNINFYAIYDGHGGKEVSTYLEKHLHKYFFLSNIDNNNTIKLKHHIKNVYNHIQNKLNIQHRNFSYKIGSTALVTIMSKDKHDNTQLYIINLGDCRAVLCNKNLKAIPLSKDHKPNSLDERKRIGKLGGKIYYDGYDWRIETLSVSRAFGDIDSKPYISHLPEIYKLKLNNLDKFIVLGCDGLWDVMDNQEVVDFVLSNMPSKLQHNNNNNNTNISKKLGEYAIQKGSTDNVSVLFKFF